MSKSRRKSRRPDPTVAPTHIDPLTGKRVKRKPFTPSPYQAAMNEAKGIRVVRDEDAISAPFRYDFDI